jgi:hypothetical protein
MWRWRHVWNCFPQCEGQSSSLVFALIFDESPSSSMSNLSGNDWNRGSNDDLKVLPIRVSTFRTVWYFFFLNYIYIVLTFICIYVFRMKKIWRQLFRNTNQEC